MKVAIMQPYFLPYIGYFQLIAAADVFIIYDNIKYTKKGWINRNRMLVNSTDAIFSLPLKKDSDTLDVVSRELSKDFDRNKLLNQFRGAYASAPYFSDVFPLLERIVQCNESNLFRYIYNSVVEMCLLLGIKTEIRISSNITIDHTLKGQDKVLALCRATGASCYINAIGGTELYSNKEFNKYNINLKFLKSKINEYHQYGAKFNPNLSIIDNLMFNSIEKIKKTIKTDYILINKLNTSINL